MKGDFFLSVSITVRKTNTFPFFLSEKGGNNPKTGTLKSKARKTERKYNRDRWGTNDLVTSELNLLLTIAYMPFQA